jgi:hypothetical protein
MSGGHTADAPYEYKRLILFEFLDSLHFFYFLLILYYINIVALIRTTRTICSFTLYSCLVATVSTSTNHLCSHFRIYTVRNIKLLHFVWSSVIYSCICIWTCWLCVAMSNSYLLVQDEILSERDLRLTIAIHHNGESY